MRRGGGTVAVVVVVVHRCQSGGEASVCLDSRCGRRRGHGGGERRAPPSAGVGGGRAPAQPHHSPKRGGRRGEVCRGQPASKRGCPRRPPAAHRKLTRVEAPPARQQRHRARHRQQRLAGPPPLRARPWRVAPLCRLLLLLLLLLLCQRVGGPPALQRLQQLGQGGCGEVVRVAVVAHAA
jgi:hypothetical protein